MEKESHDKKYQLFITKATSKEIKILEKDLKKFFHDRIKLATFKSLES
jgi:hypothetical protein